MVSAPLFPRWMNHLPIVGALATVGGAVTVVAAYWYWATPDFWQVGYMPDQPDSGFNHQIHAGKLGIDCRYCHTKVELSPEANIPNVATCIGCHAENKLAPDFDPAEKVQFLRTAWQNDESVPWRRVHKLPDYVRNFPHNTHVNAGVSCFSCHGQIGAMPEVFQEESLSMGWCLDCHRNPQKHLVEPDQVTRLAWVEQHLNERAATGSDEGQRLLDALRANPQTLTPQNCGACHY